MNRYDELLRAFERRELDGRSFTHRDHIAVAYGLLKKLPFLDASVRYGDCLQAIATRAGASRKYNTTITLAFMGLIAERMHEGADEGFDRFLENNPDLLEQNPLAGWYTSERLNTDLARRIFLLPDIRPEKTRSSRTAV